METLIDILKRHNWPLKDKRRRTVIRDVASMAGFPIPTDYIFFLNSYVGYESHIGPEYIKLWDIDELIDMNFSYGINSMLDTLGIGSNGDSEFIAIEMTDLQKHRIVLSPLIDLDNSYNVEIGTSFTDFLIRLDKGDQWIIS